MCASTSASHRGRRQLARPRDARGLVARRGRADVRIEPAGRGRDQVDRHRRGVARVGRAQASMRPLTASTSAGFSGPWLEPPEAAAVVGHRRGGRRPAPEVLRVAEVLADQRRADRLAVAHDQAAGGLRREQRPARRRSRPADRRRR